MLLHVFFCPEWRSIARLSLHYPPHDIHQHHPAAPSPPNGTPCAHCLSASPRRQHTVPTGTSTRSCTPARPATSGASVGTRSTRSGRVSGSQNTASPRASRCSGRPAPVSRCIKCIDVCSWGPTSVRITCSRSVTMLWRNRCFCARTALHLFCALFPVFV